MYQNMKNAMQRLAELDPDHAGERNNVGFAGMDVRFGHFLADAPNWKNEWAIRAYKLLMKYCHTQIVDLWEGVVSDYQLALENMRSNRNELASQFKWEDLDALEWSDPKFIAKLNKNVYEAPIPRPPLAENFWAFYKQNKVEFRNRGYSVGSYMDVWRVNYWENTAPVSHTPPQVVIELPKPKPKEEPIVLNVGDLTPLYEWQKDDCLRHILNVKKYGYTIDSSGTGTGKTIKTLMLAKKLGLKPFVICPKGPITGWWKNLRIAGMGENDIYGFVNYELIKIGKMIKYRPSKVKKNGEYRQITEHIDCPFITITANPKKGKFEPKWLIDWKLPADAVLVFDEAHRTKHKNTINTQLLLDAVEKKLKMVLLSATMSESPLDLYAVGKMLGFFDKPWEFYSWVQQYGCEKVEVNNQGVTAWKFTGNNTDLERLASAIGDRMHGLKTDDLRAKGLFPHTKIIPEIYDINGAAEKIDELTAEFKQKVKELKAKGDVFKMKHDMLHLRQKLQQEIELLKVPLITDMTEDAIEEGNSVVIFVNYVDTVRALMEALDTNCVIYGKAGSQRENNRVRFQSNESKVIICNIAAAREGIDLHDEKHERPRIAYITPNDNAQFIKQVFGRVDRAGGTDSIQYLVYAAGTVEEKVYKNVMAKIDHIDTINKTDLKLVEEDDLSDELEADGELPPPIPEIPMNKIN